MKFAALPKAIKTGNVIIGAHQTLKSMKNGTAKIVVYSADYPLKTELENIAQISGIELVPFDGTATGLGDICKMDYPISVLAVIDSGEADI